MFGTYFIFRFYYGFLRTGVLKDVCVGGVDVRGPWDQWPQIERLFMITVS